MSLSKLTKKDVPPTGNECPDLVDVGRVGEDEYYVEKILDKKMMTTVNGGGREEMHYEVKWYGWAKEFNTWEPLSNLDGSKEELKEFERRWKKKQEKISGASSQPSPGTSGTPEPNETVKVENPFKDGVEWYWPDGMEPLAMVGCFVKNRLLHYIIKVATDPPIEGISDDNVVIVLGRDFRHRYPQLVIEYYEDSITFVQRSETEEEVQAKVEKELARVKELTGATEDFDVEDKDLDEDGLPLPAEQRANYKAPSTGFDKFGLPILDEDDFSNSDDEDTFEEIVDDDDFNPDDKESDEEDEDAEEV